VGLDPTPMPVDADWRSAAVCRESAPAVFYPGGSPVAVERRTRQALALCTGCPVRQPCLEWALARPEVYGIWGGTTEEQRRARRRQRSLFSRTA
jgi:WhiB family redox-sensing transcriptional regulator